MCCKFVISPSQRYCSFVHFDAGNDTDVLQHLHQWRAIVRLVVERFVKHDHATDVLCHLSAGLEQQLPVQAPVFLRILQVYLVEALSNGAYSSISLSMAKNLASPETCVVQ